MEKDSFKLTLTKGLYIVNLRPLLPCVYATIAGILSRLFEINLPIWTLPFFGLSTVPVVFLRIFYLPYITSGVLSVVYLWFLVKEKASAKEVILFASLLAVCVLGLLSVETVFWAAMGI